MADTPERIRKALGLNPHERRYPRDEFKTLDEISDSHTLEDETREGLLEKLSGNPVLSFFVGLAGLFAFGLTIYLTLKLAPGVLKSIWTWRMVAFVVLVGGTAVLVRRGTLQKFLQYDWLILMNKNSPKLYVGYHAQPDGDADYPIFVPLKGFSLMGAREHAYKVGEVAPSNADKDWSPTDPSDPATVRLHPKFSGVAQTPFGTIVTQLARGFRYDGFGTETTLVADLPDMAAEDRLEELTDELEAAQDEIGSLEEDLAAEKRRRKDARAEAKRKRKEIREELKEDARELNPEFYRGRRGRRQDGDGEQKQNGTAPEPDFGKMEEELADASS